MAQDPASLPPPLGALSLEARTAMRDALDRFIADGEDRGELREALRIVTAEARARDLRAETLMIAFKTLWATLPSVRATTDPRMRARLLEQLITACIEEYYGK